MIPTAFEGQNGILGKPENMTDEECGGLPIARVENGIVSCWQLSDEEFQEICTNGGKIYVTLFIPVDCHPPLNISVHKPFS